jgi:hypothetical protein
MTLLTFIGALSLSVLAFELMSVFQTAFSTFGGKRLTNLNAPTPTARRSMWEAVDKDDDIGAARFITAALLHDEFIADVIDVVFGMLPVYIIEVETARIARDGLRQADAEGEQFVDFLVGADKSVIGFLPKLTDGVLKIGFAERNFVPLKADAVMLAQPVEQNILQNDIAELAAALG